MIDFSGIKKLSIDGVELKQLFINGILVWTEPVSYKNLVPIALDRSGNILDGKGYRTGAYWSSGNTLSSNSACTAIGLMPIDHSSQHDIYLYGINLTGTNKNCFSLWNEAYSNLDSVLNLKEGVLGNLLVSCEKLGEHYYKITTKTYSNKIKYFSIGGITVSGLTPIVTIDEPIM